MAHRPDRGTIVLLDDDDAFREALAAALLSLGYAVIQYCNPGALLDSIGCMTPACLIVDFHLPGMTGLEVRRLLIEQGISVPTIFLTAMFDSQVASSALAAGAIGFLRKPVRMDELEAFIARALIVGG